MVSRTISHESSPDGVEIAMANRVQMYDWSQSPLGGRADWPETLRTLVNIMLTSSFPKLVFWGPDHVMLYNDAYRPVLGRKHPDALGRPGREVFPELWPMIGPMFDKVRCTGRAIAGEDAEFVFERHGYTEETYFTYSYSPIKDDAQAVQGILVTCFETTRKVISERHMRVIGDLAAGTANAATIEEVCLGIERVFASHSRPLPFALLYLPEGAGSTLRRRVLSGLPKHHFAAPETLESGWAWSFGTPRRAGNAREFKLEPGFRTAGVENEYQSIRTALMFPLSTPGRRGTMGMLIVGINPRRALDDNYRNFLDLVASQVATAISTGYAQDLERQQAEEKLRSTNQTLETIFNAAPVAFVAIDVEGRVTNWSASAQRMFGWSAAEAIGRISPIIPARDIGDFRMRLRQITAGKGCPQAVVRQRMRKNGEKFIANIIAAPLLDGEGTPIGVLAVVEDITEREAARDAIQRYSLRLSRLSQQLIKAQETERRHIARELHDEIGQSLTLLKLHLDQTQKLLPNTTITPLETARESVGRLLASVRELCLQLRPALLDDLGLVPALLAHIERFNEQNRVHCTFHHEGVAAVRFSPLIETTVYRVVQEALTNVVRHAATGDARVALWTDESILQARIEDRGRGFNLDAELSKGTSSGLAGMLERAKLAGAELRITTAPGSGTCITLELPLLGRTIES